MTVQHMGLLLARSSGSGDPGDLGEIVEEPVARTGTLRVLACPRCHHRVCALDRDSSGGSATWRAPRQRVEKGWFGNGVFVRCRPCDRRIIVNVSKDVGGDSVPRSVPVTFPSSADSQARFRPFSVSICGAYESVVARAARLMSQCPAAAGRAVHLYQRTLRRSALADPKEADLPRGPIELMVLAHRISGQRNPLTDKHGLYETFLSRAWRSAEVVLICLFDAEPEYLAQMLEEQPTLRALWRMGRLLPIGGEDGCPDDEGDRGPNSVPSTSRPGLPPTSASADGAAATEEACVTPRKEQPDESPSKVLRVVSPSIKSNKSNGAAPVIETQIGEAADWAQWLGRCLDGQVPKVDTYSSLQQGSKSPLGAGPLELQGIADTWKDLPLVRD